MPPQRRKARRHPRPAPGVPDELLLVVRSHSRRKPDRVALQWHDGAGELHYQTLSPAQSWPFLN